MELKRIAKKLNISLIFVKGTSPSATFKWVNISDNFQTFEMTLKGLWSAFAETTSLLSKKVIAGKGFSFSVNSINR